MLMKYQTDMIFPLLFLLILALTKGDNNMEILKGGDSETVLQDDRDAAAYESFGAPAYSAVPFAGAFLNGKSAYSYPAPPAYSVPALPASYASYLANLGLNNPYAFGSYTTLPNSVPSTFGYGSQLQDALRYGYSTLFPKYGGYANPYYTNLYYTADRLGYPPYSVAGLGYRYRGAAYVPPTGKSSDKGALANGQLVARYSSALPGIAASLGPYPAPASLPVPPVPSPVFGAYRSAVPATQSKDGSVQYSYAAPDVRNAQAY